MVSWKLFSTTNVSFDAKIRFPYFDLKSTLSLITICFLFLSFHLFFDFFSNENVVICTKKKFNPAIVGSGSNKFTLILINWSQFDEKERKKLSLIWNLQQNMFLISRQTFCACWDRTYCFACVHHYDRKCFRFNFMQRLYKETRKSIEWCSLIQWSPVLCYTFFHFYSDLSNDRFLNVHINKTKRKTNSENAVKFSF